MDENVRSHSRALREMAEFMGDNGFEFAKVDAIHQAKTDFEVFSNWKEHTPEAGVIEYAGVYIGGQEDLSGEAGTGFARELADKFE